MTDVEEVLLTARLHFDGGRHEEAAILYERILKIDPQNIRALGNLGLIALASGQAETAVALIGRSVELNPYNPASQNNMGEALRLLDRAEDSLARFREAIALKPEFEQAHANLGRALLELDRHDEALPPLHAAVSLDGANVETRIGLGRALSEKGDVDGAVHHLRAALEIDPGNSYAHCVLGTVLLAGGRFAEGWPENQWRLHHYESLRPHLEFLDRQAPRWDGGPVDGKTVLLSGEQGLGDFIQYVRYAPLVAAEGARVVLDCPGKLVPLMGALPGISETIESGAPLPPVDLQATLPSLPYLLSDRVGDAIPADVPYLGVDGETVETWRRRIGSEGRLRIGVAWTGNPDYWRNATRSVPLPLFSALARIPGVRLFDLLGHGGDSGVPLESLGPEIKGGPRGLVNTAAAMMTMDLVISIDTAMAHLAGALGRPVWLLLASVHEWRWLRGREDSPWYPSLRIFRQATRGDWGEVMHRVARAAEAW